LIPGVYISISANQLISKYDQLQRVSTIQEFYKSRSFKPSILDTEALKSAALNINNYNNWWIPAIGDENLPYNGTGVRVAVIDTGMYNHTDLNIVAERGFVSGESSSTYYDDYGHGTHVAGIIGGSGKASDGKYRGVAPGVGLIDARAGDLSGLLDADIISAIQWCANPSEGNADIISMSFGGGQPEAYDPITEAISNAVHKYGVIFVASSGNSGPDYFSGGSPAAGVDVISVGATTENNSLASFSSIGPAYSYLSYVDVVAPGVNIFSTEAKDSVLSKMDRFWGEYVEGSDQYGYIPLSGTSMACPMVSGALAVLLSAYPNLTPETARIALQEGAQKLPNPSDAEFIKSGAGLINVSASLNYLNQLNQTLPDINDVAKASPDDLPVAPYDLINFPGDNQLFNVTVISGINNTLNIDIPNNIDGITVTSDQSQLSFNEPGVSFFALNVSIDQNAEPGPRSFLVNLTHGGRIYDSINVKINVKFPEGRILMDSYHGLNDWLENELTLNQMDFYGAMKQFTKLNISVDYVMEHWTPNYSIDKNTLLTKEKLAQYDLVVLQNPMLPYSPSEINNLKEYFDNGGNILFLGTRYQSLCLDNINALFSKLQTGIQINQENVVDDSFVGLGAIVHTLDATPVNNHEIFTNINKFSWDYGSTFKTTGNAIPVAKVDNKTVTAVYDGSSLGKGKLVAFGDLHWMSTDYNAPSYSSDHKTLVTNLANYLVKQHDVSLTVDLNTIQSTNSQINISVYAKNLKTNDLISSSTLNSNLSVSIANGGSKENIMMNSNKDGIAINDTYNLMFGTSYNPYIIQVNLTYGSHLYQRTSKVLFYNINLIPKISSLSLIPTNRTRTEGSFTISTDLDNSNYSSFNAYLSIYSSSFYNSKQSINSTVKLNHVGNPLSTSYDGSFDPTTNDPTGYLVIYIIPSNANYSTFNSPRIFGRVLNVKPTIVEDLSSFSIGDQTVKFSDTKSDGSSKVYGVSQGTSVDFSVDVSDASTEDTPAEMNVYVNFFMVVLSDKKFSNDNSSYILPIPSDTYSVKQLSYQQTSEKHTGTFIIPREVSYSTIQGEKSISTAADLRQEQDYAGILWIHLWDSDGGTDDFIIIVSISASFTFDPTTIIIIAIIIGGIIGAGILIYIIRRSKRSKPSETKEYTYSTTPYTEPYKEAQRESYDSSAFYCPFCGVQLRSPKKFCPNCGKSLEFD
ncbi:MAG: S8 family serine peptidase, partial [Candidatus Lokiarchaeota archaeon]